MRGATAGFWVLLRADARRLSGVVGRPTVAVWLGLALPSLLLAAGVRAIGEAGDLRLASIRDGVTLGVLVGGPIAFVAYATLFRGGDDGFLRQLGVAPVALYWERALRLLAWGGGAALLVALAYTAAGAPAATVALVGIPALAAAWGAALLSFCGAARAMAGHPPGARWGCLAAGMWDREVAAAAPLVYAPVPPLVAGAVGGGLAMGAEGGGRAALLAVGLLGVGGLAAAARGARSYVAALPRFAPQALEMSFAPAPAAEGSSLRQRRGLARLLPRRAAAAWARDGAVAGRRFAWASRATWPVVIFSLVALARWGREPGTRVWVGAAVLLALVLQGVAAIGMGRAERRRARWLDRAVGVTPAQRFMGRWAWGWGLSLWMMVPVSLAWTWWSGAGAGWPWIVLGAGSSGVAAAASMAAAGRR